tara:strand:- start:624 stop:842 length:219 start_codon:yes stop_codon:yes gene_type:complete
MHAVRTVRASRIAAALAVLGKASVATELNTRGKQGSTSATVRRKKQHVTKQRPWLTSSATQMMSATHRRTDA